MDFTREPEHLALADAVGGALKRHYESIEDRRKVVAVDPGFTAWGSLAELGVLSLPWEASAIEVGIVAEEIGKVIAPEPYVQSVVLAGGLIDALGSDDQRRDYLDKIESGDILAAAAWLEPGARWNSVAKETTFSGGVLNGTKTAVVAGERADVLVVTAALEGGGTGAFLVTEGYSADTKTAHDGSRVATVTFENTSAVALGAGGDQQAAIDRAIDISRIAHGHEALGAMEFALATTVEYLKTRKQFGVPLKTFQALTFRAADMYVAIELARSAIGWASLVASEEGVSNEAIAAAASQAALQVSVAGRHVGAEAIQLHGGIGMTAEYSVGHYTSRLIAIEHLIGDGAFHQARLADSVNEHGVFEVVPV